MHVWLNKGGDGAGGWVDRGVAASGVGAPLNQVQFTDFDGDGRTDCIVVADNGSAHVWLNKGGD